MLLQVRPKASQRMRCREKAVELGNLFVEEGESEVEDSEGEV